MAEILNLESSKLPKSASFEFNLEALRGFAAFTVVLSHYLGFSSIMQNGYKATGIFKYAFPGHFCVLLFFILSGYVIGLSTKSKLTWSTTLPYAKKRIIRLYPIYIICIVLGLFVSNDTYSLKTVLSNIFFLQGITSKVIFEVNTIWSLNFEILFYILFIPISIYSIKPSFAIIFFLIVGLFFQFIIPITLVNTYSYGFCFWLIGLYLATTKSTTKKYQSIYSLVGLIFLMLSFESLNYLYELSHFKFLLDKPLDNYINERPGVTLSDLTNVPVIVVLILFFSNKNLKLKPLLVGYTFITPLLFILFQIYKSTKLTLDLDSYIFAYTFYILGIIFMIIGKGEKSVSINLLPKYIINIGSISYALYLIHFPVMIFFGKINIFGNDTVSYIIKFFTSILVSIVIAYLLEKKLQPYIASIFRPNRKTISN